MRLSTAEFIVHYRPIESKRNGGMEERVKAVLLHSEKSTYCSKSGFNSVGTVALTSPMILGSAASVEQPKKYDKKSINFLKVRSTMQRLLHLRLQSFTLSNRWD